MSTSPPNARCRVCSGEIGPGLGFCPACGTDVRVVRTVGPLGAPRLTTPVAVPGDPALDPVWGGYRSLGLLGAAASVLLFLSVVGGLAGFGVESWIHLQAGMPGVFPSAPDLGQGPIMLARMAAAAVGSLTSLLAPVAFMVWFYRAHANLHALGRVWLRFNSEWAITGFLVPVLNLFRPWQVMQELWRETCEAAGTRPETARLGGWLVTAWWAASLSFVGLTLASAATIFVAAVATGMPGPFGSVGAQGLCLAARTASGMLVIVMIRHITVAQTEAWRRVSQYDGPPAPIVTAW